MNQEVRLKARKVRVMSGHAFDAHDCHILGNGQASLFVSLIPPVAIRSVGERQTEDLEVPGSIPGVGMKVLGRCSLTGLNP